MGLNFSKNELIHVRITTELKEFCSILCIFGKTWLYIVLHDFNLTYYSSIILGPFSILFIPKIMLAYWPHPYEGNILLA